MERVIIIGCGGSGKTTLARKLSIKTGLPVVHLDQIFWSPGNWVHLNQTEFDRLLKLELEKPRWIMDGNYDRTLPLRLESCDTVIWLDYSRFICLLQWVKRVITNRMHARQDMAPGCNEWFDPQFAGWIWNFNRKHRKHYQTILESQTNKDIYIFKNRRQLNRYLKNR